MSLFAYNLTIAPLALAAGSPIVTLPASASAGARGPAMDVTAELNALTAPDFALLQAQVAAGQVQFEWSGLPEYNTYTLVVGSAQEDVADNDFVIYVDDVTGNDANPGTATAPLKTAQAAFRKCPPMWRKSAAVQFAAGTYVMGGTTVLGTGVGPQATPLEVRGTPIGAVDAALAPLGTMVIDSTNPNFTSVVATTPATNLNAYRGAFLRNLTTGSSTMITGSSFAAGQTTFTLLKSDGLVVQTVGDEFIVETPNTIFQTPMFDDTTFTPTGAVGAVFRNIKFAGDPGSFLGFIPILVVFGFNYFDACHFDGVVGRRAVCSRGSRWYIPAQSPPAFIPQLAGLYFVNGGFEMSDRSSCNFSFVADASVFDVGNLVNMVVPSSDLENCAVSVDNLSQAFFIAGASRDATDAFGAGALTVSNQSSLSVGLSTDGYEITSPGGAGFATVGIVAKSKSLLRTGLVGSAGSVPDFGLRVIETSTALVDAVNTTIDGASGDIDLDGVATVYGVPTNGVELSRVANA